MRAKGLLVVGVLALAGTWARAAEAPMAPTFPFVMPSFDSTPTAVDMSFLNPDPAGAKGFIRVRGDHFVDGTGKRVRFLGTNLTFEDAFPPKENAPKVAARLRKLGMNIVRFHHIDNRMAPGGLWLPEQKGIDPEQLDRLDWLIFQLKQHGIYSNINLHVSRSYPGLPKDAPRTFNYGKMLDKFHRPFIDMQREYARALLTHVNPYTGKSYAEEPAIAAVEINNENTLLTANWSVYRSMPEPFQGDLAAQWRTWLKRRYPSTAALRKVWDVGSEPLGDEMLANGDFSKGVDGWSFQRSQDAEGSMDPVSEGPVAGRPALLLHTTKQGKIAWEFQLLKPGLTLEEGAPYTITFQAKSDKPQAIGVDLRLDQEPWTNCGLGETVDLKPDWQTISYTFRASKTVPGHVRVTIGLRNQIGRFWIAGVSLRRGGLLGLPPEQSLEAGSIPVPPPGAGPAWQRDFWEFLVETERAYVAEMVAFPKKDLRVQAPVIDTQASYGGIAGVSREATLCDFIDMHAYWQHPSFPGKPWDGNNWTIGNTPMSAREDGGTLFRLASHRVLGKPFTVSEYDHPAPSFYSAEMFPMFASFAAFQDWDGLYQFCYGRTASDPDRIGGYFTMNVHPGKVAFMPIAALLFRGEAVKPGGAPVVLEVPTDSVVAQLGAHGTDTGAIWRAAGADKALPLHRRVAVRVRRGKGEPRLSGARASEPEARRSETGEIAWDAAPPETALYTVNAPSARIATGYVGGRTVSLGDVSFTVPAGSGRWASIALGALDGQPIERSRRLLLVAMGRFENTGMEWNETFTTVGRKWGQGPTRAEGVALTVRLPGKASGCQALDGTGKETRVVPLQASGNGASVTVGPEYETVWYLITR